MVSRPLAFPFLRASLRCTFDLGRQWRIEFSSVSVVGGNLLPVLQIGERCLRRPVSSVLRLSKLYILAVTIQCDASIEATPLRAHFFLAVPSPLIIFLSAWYARVINAVALHSMSSFVQLLLPRINTQSVSEELSPGIVSLFIQGLETGLVISQFSQWLYLGHAEGSAITLLVLFVTTVGLSAFTRFLFDCFPP